MLKSARGHRETATAEAGTAAPPGGWRAARPRLLWVLAVLAAGAALFWCYLRQSRTAAVNSDGSAMVLQGWDMLHGNLLLSGWWLSDVTFYTFEVPVDALVAAVRGLNVDVVHISAALIYTLLVLTAALLAKGTARGAEGVTRALIGAGVLLAPSLSPGSRILILSPDHTGVGVPILATLLFLDRVRERWWVPLAACALLTWAQLDDPLATFAAALPIALVGLVRAGAGLVRRRRAAWYDAGLAAAAVASAGLTQLAVSAIRAAGGFTMHSLRTVGGLTPSSAWPAQIKAAGQNVLILFGADFFEQPSGIRTAIAFAHFAGVALALAGLLIGIAGLFRGADRVTQALTLGTLVTLGAGAFGTHMILVQGAHEIAVVLPLGAVLAGRTVGPWLIGRRLPRISLTPLLGAALACYLAALGYSASRPAVPAETQGLADWLTAHQLTRGLSGYWAADSTTLASGGRVRVAPASGAGRAARPWEANRSWYDPAVSYANFVLATPGKSNAYAFSERAVQRVFGKPGHVYRYGPYLIMVWDRNLLLQVSMPTQRQVTGP